MTIEAKLHRANGALTTLSNGRHVWNSDVDKTLGSDGLAPDPHDLLDSALAACTTLTLELYIRRHQMPVTDLRVTVDRVEGKNEQGQVSYQMQRRIFI
jgi:putative redox protein